MRNRRIMQGEPGDVQTFAKTNQTTKEPPMAGSSAHEVTQLLRAWNEGEQSALEKLMPVVYDELHRMAQGYMAHEGPGHTLEATALVNEACLRLVDSAPTSWQNRAHFFAVCAQAMRRILVDWARSRQAMKRGGEMRPLKLDEALAVAGTPGKDLVALDEALKALAAVDPRKSQVVELRFFGGLSVEETAEVLKVSSDTVRRDWKVAKSWLQREMRGENPDGA
jgi:RNA polymerase sigma factor (TIGR02999 family)